MKTFLPICLSSILAALSCAAASRTAPAVRPGVKAPGIQVSFSGVIPEATVPSPDKASWTFFMPGTPAGGGGRGGRGGGGGRGAGASAPGAPAPGFLYIPAADKLMKVDTKTNKAVDPVAGLKDPCGGMVSAFGSLWVPTCGDGALQRIDPKTSKVTATIPSGVAHMRGSIAASADSIWLLADNKETLSRIDPDQNAVVGEIRLPAGCRDLTFGETFLWIACPDQNRILKINAATNVVEKRIEVADRPVAIALGETSVWVFCAKEGKVDRIDPKTDKVTKTIELQAAATQGEIAVSDGYVWVSMNGFPVTRIDPVSETVAQQFYGEGGGALTAAPGAIWLANPGAATVTRIDPKLLLATFAE